MLSLNGPGAPGRRWGGPRWGSSGQLRAVGCLTESHLPPCKAPAVWVPSRTRGEGVRCFYNPQFLLPAKLVQSSSVDKHFCSRPCTFLQHFQVV